MAPRQAQQRALVQPAGALAGDDLAAALDDPEEAEAHHPVVLDLLAAAEPVPVGADDDRTRLALVLHAPSMTPRGDPGTPPRVLSMTCIPGAWSAPGRPS
ncbi:hypothetical protein GCM10009714_39340 [Microlunatus capsulatus]